MRENQAEDDRCLANVEEHIENQTKLGAPVAGVIVEPIQAEGGDYHGSKEFFQVYCFEIYLVFYNILAIKFFFREVNMFFKLHISGSR